MGRAAASIALTGVERRELESLSRARKTGQAMARRTRIVLAAAAGLENKAICAEVGADTNTVPNGAAASQPIASRGCWMSHAPARRQKSAMTTSPKPSA